MSRDTPAARLEQAVAALRRGELVAFPTETVYGLGADARNVSAVRRIFELKGRPPSHPLIVHLAPDAPLSDWAARVPPPVAALAAAFWPGPLTLVLPRAAGVPDVVTGGQDTIGLRKPSHPVARALLERFGGGIAGPSANRYGHISPTSAAHVADEFGSQAPLILEGGDCAVGLESTIVGWVDDELVLLRPGGLGLADLQRIAGPIATAPRAGAPRVSGSHHGSASMTSMRPCLCSKCCRALHGCWLQACLRRSTAYPTTPSWCRSRARGTSRCRQTGSSSGKTWSSRSATRYVHGRYATQPCTSRWQLWGTELTGHRCGKELGNQFAN